LVRAGLVQVQVQDGAGLSNRLSCDDLNLKSTLPRVVMSLRWKKLSATTSAVPVRRGAKTLQARPCHLHLVRAESAPNANGGKQLVPLPLADPFPPTTPATLLSFLFFFFNLLSLW
jgi:hypothetical protein